MQVIVKGRHTKLPRNIKELATHKLEKVQRLFDRIQKLEIEFTEEHNPRIADKHKVEVTLTTKAHTLRAHASGPDPMSAVDQVVDKLTRQVRRLKGKLVSRSRSSSRSNGATPGGTEEGQIGAERRARNGEGGPIESLEGSAEGEPSGSSITRVKRFTIKPMTAEEAVLQMELLGHDFYLFVNAESEQAGVVYRRKDGSFGLIEPS